MTLCSFYICGAAARSNKSWKNTFAEKQIDEKIESKGRRKKKTSSKKSQLWQPRTNSSAVAKTSKSKRKKGCFYTFFVINFFLFNFFDTGEEFLYRNQWGGISLLNVVNLSERVLMSNFTFVSCFFNFIEYLRFKSQLRSTRLEGLNAYLVETCSK